MNKRLKDNGCCKALFKKRRVTGRFALPAIAILCLMSAWTAVSAQKISITLRDAPFQTAIKELQKKQPDYSFSVNERYLKQAKPVSLQISNVEFTAALSEIFRNQPFSYKMDGKRVVAVDRSVQQDLSPTNQQTIRGKVTDEKGEPLAGASLSVKGTSLTTTTDNEGNFIIPDIASSAVLIISYIGYEKQEMTANNAAIVVLSKSLSSLNEVQVIGYGTASKRLNTGSVASISAKDIETQPISNPLAALSGRMPGLVVTQSTGNPGSSFSLQIRGRNSIAQGSEPLILIDGIPFAPGNDGMNTLVSAISTPIANSTLSPFSTINPADIERIDVLKDADATAIYGSRGANGVILITTKKGAPGKASLTANVSRGITRTPKTMQFMNSEQYLEMRREAFANTNTTPTLNDAPDLLAWDQNRYTDYTKELIGNTGYLLNGQLSLSGGSENTQFLLGGGFNRETSVFPGDLPNDRGSANFNIRHVSADNRLNVLLSGSFSASKNISSANDLTYYTAMPPNTGEFFNENGTLKWSEAGAVHENPYAYLLREYKATSNNLLSSMNVSYQILPYLKATALLGYNQLHSKDQKLTPLASLSPNVAQVSSSEFGTKQFSGWNIEPQLEFDKQVWIGKLNILAGFTLHEKQNTGSYIKVSGYSSDALMESIQAASTVDARSNSYTLYRYSAAFGRINYNIADKYILNITGRLDGSSRFGPGKQFANFGAIGGAYIVSEEHFVKDNLSFLSFAKLRASYGVTGNDQIGDYQFLDTWQAFFYTYQNMATLYPPALFNNTYGWEENKKVEGAIDLGFLKDRILLSTSYYRNRSDNQLVQYRLPYTTGYTKIIRNFPAIVQNSGWEFHLSADIARSKNFSYSSSINMTLPSNKLLEFPDIETSSYYTQYVIGEPLDLINGYNSAGVDPATGLYTYIDKDENGFLTVDDYTVHGSLVPKFYGGFNNTFSFKGITVDAFIDFRKQTGRNYLYSIYQDSKYAGTMSNQPIQMLDRWQEDGQITNIEKFVSSTQPGQINFLSSNLGYRDQSFIRLRTLSIGYDLPKAWVSKAYAKTAQLYIQAQNLFTINSDKYYNAETQYLYRLPPLKMYNIGFRFTY